MRLAIVTAVLTLLVVAGAGVVEAAPPTPTPIPQPTFMPTPTAIPTSTRCPTLTPLPTPTARATPTPLPTPAFPTLVPPAHWLVGTPEITPTCALTYSASYYSQTNTIHGVWISTTWEITQVRTGLTELAVYLGLTTTGEAWAPGILSGTTVYSFTHGLAVDVSTLFSYLKAAEQIGATGTLVVSLLLFLSEILLVQLTKVVLAFGGGGLEVIRRLWNSIPIIGGG